jgi:hypothetical protein
MPNQQGLSLTRRARRRAGARGIVPALAALVGVLSLAIGSRHMLQAYQNDRANRSAGRLYRDLAEEEFGAGILVEEADLGDETVTQLTIPLPGANLRQEIREALDRISGIHRRVEQIDPMLAGRIIFDFFSPDGSPS